MALPNTSSCPCIPSIFYRSKSRVEHKLNIGCDLIFSRISGNDLIWGHFVILMTSLSSLICRSWPTQSAEMGRSGDTGGATDWELTYFTVNTQTLPWVLISECQDIILSLDCDFLVILARVQAQARPMVVLSVRCNNIRGWGGSWPVLTRGRTYQHYKRSQISFIPTEI